MIHQSALQMKSLIFTLLVLFTFSLGSCEDGYQYQKIRIDAKNKKIEILSNEFVFDSIVIENNDVTFFNGSLLDKKQGTNIFDLNDTIENNYRIVKDHFDEMCYEKNDTGMKNIVIYIRNKNYDGPKKNQDRENIQKFVIGEFPCDNQTIILEAIGWH